MVELVSMQYIETLFIINFFVCAIVLGLGMFLSHLLFRSLKKEYAAYYKSIGEPLVAIVAPTDFTWGDYVQLLKGAAFGYVMVFRGIPQNFPKDEKLRKLASSIRIIFLLILVLFTTLFVTAYLFYKSTL